MKSNVQKHCSLSFRPSELPNMKLYNGGGERDRTDDPLLAKQVLSQLSYTPNFKVIILFHIPKPNFLRAADSLWFLGSGIYIWWA